MSLISTNAKQTPTCSPSTLFLNIRPPPFKLYIQPQRRDPRQSYNPHRNTIGAQQTYTMNRFLDEIPDFRTRGILQNDTRAYRKNVEHRAALGARMGSWTP